jgi:hypothetical protein
MIVKEDWMNRTKVFKLLLVCCRICVEMGPIPQKNSGW